MTRTGKFARKIRQHRDTRAFDRALRTASPAMQQELLAAAAHHFGFER
jgi:hypothetical protein